MDAQRIMALTTLLAELRIEIAERDQEIDRLAAEIDALRNPQTPPAAEDQPLT